MKRRTFVKGGLAALGFTALSSYGVLHSSGISCAGPRDGFTNPLPVPPLLEDLSSHTEEEKLDIITFLSRSKKEVIK